jgi:hypothetical protein
MVRTNMLGGPSAPEYGPIQVTASGDNVLPTRRTFRFDCLREPMIYD